MQSNNEVMQNVEQGHIAQTALRTWTKPEAKIAEVAQVTLFGNTQFRVVSDLATCSS